VLLSTNLGETTLANHRTLSQTMPAGTDLVLLLTKPLRAEAARLGVDWEVLDPPDIFLPEFGAKSASGRVVPGNADLVIMAFFRRRPWYEHVWLVEDDVFFPAGAGILHALDAASAADLIVAHPLGTRERSPEWFHWPSFAAPPEVAATLHPRDCLQSMFCVSRYGARLFAALEDAFRAGWVGHNEAVVPTIARHRGLRIENLNQISERLTGRRVLSGRTFGIGECVAERDALIYHPAKTLETQERIRRDIASLPAG
jgi:hypothetical protein